MPSVAKRYLARLCEAQNHRCAYCGIRFGARIWFGKNHWWEPPWTCATVDHFVTLSERRNDAWANLLAACKRCNELRGNMDAMLFFETKGWLSHGREQAADRKGYLVKLIRNALPVDPASPPKRRRPDRMPKRRFPPQKPGTQRPFAGYFKDRGLW